MTTAKPSDFPTKHYFFDETNLKLYIVPTMDKGAGLVYLGSSNNPNVKMAAAAFTQKAKTKSGFTIVEL